MNKGGTHIMDDLFEEAGIFHSTLFLLCFAFDFAW